MRRLRGGELLALLGGAAVVVGLFVREYQNAGGDLNAFDTFGPAVVLLIAAALAAFALAATTLAERSPALPVAATVWTTLLGLVAMVAAIVRVLERPQHATNLCAGSWLVLAGAVAIFAGAWLAMGDERTSRHDAASVEPKPHP
jgi:cytochrome bd-type quinol oxidase subunit 2